MLVEVAGVGHLALHQAAIIGDVQRQVEMRALLVQRVLADVQPGQLQGRALLHADILVELGLEQRVVAEGALGREHFDQLLEGQLLVGLGGQGRLAHLGQQRAQRQALVDHAAQHLGVDEEADQALHLFTAAVGIGHTDADIALA